MDFTDCQARADEAFHRFVNDPDMIVFGLFGFAGTGKSMMTSQFIKNHMGGKNVLLASPTHKAAHVLRGFLRSNDIDYIDVAQATEFGKKLDKIEDIVRQGFEGSRYHEMLTAELLAMGYVEGAPIVGTTAQLLGIRPDISQEQDAHTLKFSKVAKGLIETQSKVDWVIVDEVSMLSMHHFEIVLKLAKEKNAKVLVVGDPGQLPPVNAGAIPFERFGNRATLEQVVRTDSKAILDVSQAVRDGRNFRDIRGEGVRHVDDAANAYLAALSEPPGEEEQLWSVYVAYRNVAVNAVSDAACRILYGHGSGEVVLATNTLTRTVRTPMWHKETLCSNGETLVVQDCGSFGEWGQTVTMRSVSSGLVFAAEYLPENEARNPESHYNRTLKQLRSAAEDLQKRFKNADRDEAQRIDQHRRQAWAAYFQLRDDTVLGLVHPFAITSHKSQGSSYRRAFVDATDMQAFDPRALYVGVTRPKEELVVG